MFLIFPAAGIFFSVITVILKDISGIDMVSEGLLYALDYTLLLILIYVVFILVLGFSVNTEKPDEKFSVFYNKVIGFTLRIALSACSVKVKIEGEEKIPKGRFVLIQNHKAMFDPLVTLAFLGKYEIGFITKPENTNIPVVNRYMRKICCVPIDRENPRNAVKSINAAADNVKNNVCSMAIYPEGTRSRDGEMLPFHAGSFKIATKAGAPLVITTVDNTNRVHRNAPFRRTLITLRVCEVIPAEEVSSSGTAELSERARKIMLSSLGINEE